MGRIFAQKLEGRFYSCKFCNTHLAHADHIISKAFHCRRGKAYLLSRVVNVTFGPRVERIMLSGMHIVERIMLSGMHIVADIYCVRCGQIIGWKYEASEEETQKYKEGKYVIESARIVDNLDTDFSIDTRPSTSHGDDS